MSMSASTAAERLKSLQDRFDTDEIKIVSHREGREFEMFDERGESLGWLLWETADQVVNLVLEDDWVTDLGRRQFACARWCDAVKKFEAKIDADSAVYADLFGMDSKRK